MSVARAALAAFVSMMGGGVAGAAAQARVLIGVVGERGGCVGQERCASCPVGDQGLVCDVRGVGDALAAVPEGQGDASTGDFV